MKRTFSFALAVLFLLCALVPLTALAETPAELPDVALEEETPSDDPAVDEPTDDSVDVPDTQEPSDVPTTDAPSEDEASKDAAPENTPAVKEPAQNQAKDEAKDEATDTSLPQQIESLISLVKNNPAKFGFAGLLVLMLIAFAVKKKVIY